MAHAKEINTLHVEENIIHSSEGSLCKDEVSPSSSTEDWTPEEERKLVCALTHPDAMPAPLTFIRWKIDFRVFPMLCIGK